MSRVQVKKVKKGAMVKNDLCPSGDGEGADAKHRGSGRVVGDGSVMLTPENIVVLRACACSASKLLIFATSP